MDEKNLVSRYCRNYGLDETRITCEMVMRHWNLERRLTGKMRSCPVNERARVFKESYHELYASCPWLVSTGTSVSGSDNGMNWWTENSLPPKAKILEIGGGAGKCAKEISRRGFDLTCIDLSDERVVQAQRESDNPIRFLEGDATCLQFPGGTFDAVYSYQMIEHLHPDDAEQHFREVHRVLKTGGFYYFTTPNRIWGPSDISRVFGCREARGMHLKEYSYDEICRLLADSGYGKSASPLVNPYLCHTVRINPPLATCRIKCAMESILKKIPRIFSDPVARILVVRSVMVVAWK